MSQRLDPSLVRHGRVNGRYFRENFAQGGIDLVQIVPELVTNADAAIAAGGRSSGRIVLRFGPPDPAFAAEWKRAMRRLRAPALLEWRHELRCSDDGVGMDAAAVELASAAPAGPVDESKVPHYFGPYPNWANSPLTVSDADVSITPAAVSPVRRPPARPSR